MLVACPVKEKYLFDVTEVVVEVCISMYQLESFQVVYSLITWQITLLQGFCKFQPGSTSPNKAQGITEPRLLQQ